MSFINGKTLSAYYDNMYTGNKWTVPVTIKRSNDAPLDSTTLFKSYDEAERYARGESVSCDAAGKYVTELAYPGQYIAVVPVDGSETSAFIINGQGELVPLATGGDLEATLTQIRNDLNLLSGETVSDISALSDAIDVNISAISSLSTELDAIKDATLGDLSNLEKKLSTDLAITVEKQASTENGILNTYVIKQGGVQVGETINIPKDFLVKSAEIKTAETDLNADIQAGEKYIDFVINSLSGDDNESHVYLALNDLVDVYTGISSDTVTVSIDEDRKVQAVVNDGSIGWTKLDTEVNNWKESVELSTTNLCAEVAANDADIAYISGQVDLSVAELESKIANVASDASDAAASALTDAKAYTDEVSAGLSVDTKIAEAKKYAEDAAISVLADAKAYVDDLSIADTYATKAELEAHETEFTALISGVSAEAIASANAYTDAKIDEKIGQIDFAKLSTDTLNDAKAYTNKEVEALSTSLSNEITAVQETVAANLTTAEGYAISVLGDAKKYVDDLDIANTYATKTELANKGQELSDYVDSKVADLNIGDYATKAEVDAISTDHEGRIATLESGTSALSGRMDKVESDITSISSNYATTKYVDDQDAATLTSAKDYIDEKIATLGNPLRFIGVVGAVTDVENPQDGDVVLVGTKEFVYNNGKWTEFGDESTHATVTALDAEKQAREAADAYISAAVDNKIFAGDYGNIVSADSLSVIKITQADYANLLADEKADPNAVYIVNSDGAYDMYGERVINVATPELSADAANKDYVDTEIAKAKAEVIAEIPLSVSQLTWDISAIYCGGAND